MGHKKYIEGEVYFNKDRRVKIRYKDGGRMYFTDLDTNKRDNISYQTWTKWGMQPEKAIVKRRTKAKPVMTQEQYRKRNSTFYSQVAE